MRIMIDANVAVSAFITPNAIVANIVKYIKANHVLVMSQYAIDEVVDTFIKKFPSKLIEVIDDIDKLPHEIVDFIIIDKEKYPFIHDPKDLPILVAAIESQVDILITGDLHFDVVKLDKPRIMKPRQFQDEYM